MASESKQATDTRGGRGATVPAGTTCSQPSSSASGKAIVVMPAYNAQTTLEQTVADIPPGCIDEIILVDDCSRDDTVAMARRLGLTVIQHERNLGYGGNQKTCYREALAREADIVIMIHPDYQYDSRLVPLLVWLLRTGHCDMVLGNRIRTRREARAGGMPAYKYFANRILTIMENLWMGQNLGECHSGMRGYRRQVLETVPWQGNSDDFVFDSQFLVQAVHFGFRIGDIPVPVRYMKEASSISFRRSVTYGLGTLGVLARWTLHRLGLARSSLFEPRPDRPTAAGRQTG
jgi:glycosyltransferase involved in cell wall biosynthesis